MLKQAIGSFTSALEIQTPENDKLDWAWTQRELADAYSELAILTRDDLDIRRSIAASQAALTVYTLDRTPRSWAQTMHDMAVAQQEAAAPEKRKEVLQKASAIYEQVLAAISSDELPIEYALSLGNLGSARIERGQLGKDEALLESGIASLRQTVDLYDHMQRPLDMAFHMLDIGSGLVTLGNLRSTQAEPQQAIETYQRAIDLYQQGGDAKQATYVRGQLASAQAELGYQRSKAGDHRGAVEAYQASLDNRDRVLDPENWLFSANQVAIALNNQGVNEDGVDTLRKAADAYRVALSATSADAARQSWTETQLNLIDVLRVIGERSRTAPDYIAIADAYGTLVSLKDRTRDRNGRDVYEANRAWALSLAGEYGSDLKLLDQSTAAYRDVLKAAGIPELDRVFYVLNFSRTLFIAANLGGGDAARREAIAVVDANWPLIDKEGSAEQKVNALIDRANLIYQISFDDPTAFSHAEVEDAFARAVSVVDPTADPELRRTAQRALAGYQLAGLQDPNFPRDQMQSGLGTLRSLLEKTPKQADPRAWAEVANWYGYALSVSGKRENATASFEEALPLLRDALSVYDAANDALSVAHTRDSLCAALVGLGRLQKQRALVAEGIENCDNAVAYMRDQKLTDVLAIAEANQADARKALAEFDGQPQ